MVTPNPLQRLRDLNNEFHKHLIDILHGDEYRDILPNLENEDLAWLVGFLDNVLAGISDPTNTVFPELLHELRRISGIKKVLPKSCTFSGDVSLPPASGSTSERTLGSLKVRIKYSRTHPEAYTQESKETFHRVAVVWKHLAHPNIVPFLGVTVDPPLLVSDWMPDGDLVGYITSHPDVDRLGLLSDIAEGLNYLHSYNVIHGDLKGSSVLVDTTGHARITDFGLYAVTHNLNLMRSTPAEHGHNARWIAPEILDYRGTYSKQGDIFSFAMVVIEVFSCAVPFGGDPPHTVILAIIGGERPPRPANPTFTDGFWALAQRCWDQEAHLRPQASEVLQILRGLTWKHLISQEITERELISLIEIIFSDHNEIEAVWSLCGDDAQAVIDAMDKVLDLPDLEPGLLRKCLRTLCMMCSRQALLPRALQIPHCYDRSSLPWRSGGFGEVWMGEHQGHQVAVKVLAVYLDSDFDKVRSSFCKEVMTWRTLHHPNVLPLLGVTMGDNHFAMVSDWMANGNIMEFLEAHGDVNRFELLQDVARGLIYMHGRTLIHGDLKGANILVDQEGHARLADFGFLTIASGSTHFATSNACGGTIRWMSPELLDPDTFGLESSLSTKESDCYALGMVILEVLSGGAPFKADRAVDVIRKVTKGEHPGRPQGAEGLRFTDDLWQTLRRCWSPQPKNRPTIKVVLECLIQETPSSMGAMRTIPQDVQQLVGRIQKHCKKIHVAKKQSSHLRDLCSDIIKRLIDRSLILRQSNYEEIKSNLTSVEGKLAVWSKYNYPKSLLKESEIESGITECTKQLTSALPQREGAGEWLASAVTEIGHSKVRFNEPLLRPAAKRGTRDSQSINANELPPVKRLDGEVVRTMEIPFSEGTHYDLWAGQWEKGAGEVGGVGIEKVAMKALKPRAASVNMLERLEHELPSWVILHHQNVQPFYGIVTDIGPHFCMVSPWQEKGNLLDYVKKYPQSNKHKLLRGAAAGLSFLHSRGIVHGSVKCTNVLISSEDEALICDFTITIIALETTENTASKTVSGGDHIRRSAMELLECSVVSPTANSDTYSFAMLILECITEEPPFSGITRDAAVVHVRVIKRQSPPRPGIQNSKDSKNCISDNLWNLMMRCWSEKPDSRPTMEQGHPMNVEEAKQ